MSFDRDALLEAARSAAGLDDLGDLPFDEPLGCVFLASDEAEYINGVLLPIDGGMTGKLGVPDTSALSAIGEG